MTLTAGLDVGGAHLKVALAEDGRIVDVRQIACPLWQGLDKLDAALSEARPLLSRAAHHAVTMTGELSDLFADRLTGVATLVECLERETGPATRFWLGVRGFGDGNAAKAHPRDAGSTNFLASACVVAGKLPDALLIDFGSTTADVVAIVGGQPAARGLMDADRLATGELVYTGLTRTPVMGVTTRAPFKGRMQSLAREYLATMADVRRILGMLPPDVDQHATADGRDKSLEQSLARLARMLGHDAVDGTLADWRETAAFIREEQLGSILAGCRDVLAGTPLAPEAPVVAAGIGADEVAVAARALGRRTLDFGELAGAGPECRLWATRCAPAVAVALLLGP